MICIPYSKSSQGLLHFQASITFVLTKYLYRSVDHTQRSETNPARITGWNEEKDIGFNPAVKIPMFTLLYIGILIMLTSIFYNYV